MEQNQLCNFGKRHVEEQFCDIISNLDQWFRRCCLKIFLIWSSGGPFCSVEPNYLCNFGKGQYEEHSCGIILNLDQWFRRKCHYKTFLIKRSGSPFVRRSRTFCAILVEHEEQFCKKNAFGPLVQAEMSFEDISYLKLWRPFCSAAQNHLCNFCRR